MKKLLNGVIIFIISSQLLVAYNTKEKTNTLSATCSSNTDATNMMIRSQQISSQLQKEYFKKKSIYDKAYEEYKKQPLKNSDELKKINLLSKDMTKASNLWSQYVKDTIDIGRIINRKDYQEACDKYISIAKNYGFDLLDSSMQSLTVKDFSTTAEIKKDSCTAVQSNIIAVLFTIEVAQQNKAHTKIFQDFSAQSAGLSTQDPIKLCRQIKKTAEQLSISYDKLLEKTKTTIGKANNRISKQAKTQKENEKNNKICSYNDAVALYYKEKDFRKNKLLKLSDEKSVQYTAARNASLQNSKLIKTLLRQRNDIYKVTHDFSHDVVDNVEPYVSNGKYDLACSNYKKIEDKYNKILQDLVETQKNELTKFQSSSSNTSSIQASQNDKNNTFDAQSQQKYNDMVDVINNFTPKIQHSFKTYVQSCGSDENKRQKEIFTTVAGTKVKLPNYYAVHAYYKGYYKKNALKHLDDALSISRLEYANSTIKHYKKSLLTFTKLFTEASEYYEMKDYTDDDFKKGDQMHVPLVAAYKDILTADHELRRIIGKIADEQTLAEIQAYKANNNMMFYYVEKSRYLAKKYIAYASSVEDSMTLDPTILKKHYDAQRATYDEFKIYKQNNEQLFTDNSKYTYYLSQIRDYLSISKEFYIHVKNKKSFSSSNEEEFFKNLPPQARAAIMQNKEGSIQKLINSYNTLIKEYNSLR